MSSRRPNFRQGHEFPAGDLPSVDFAIELKNKEKKALRGSASDRNERRTAYACRERTSGSGESLNFVRQELQD
jgi:hypothetical protein